VSLENLNKQPISVAFYLPQFHPIPENNLWWGNGFTEWTNVGKAKPLYRGHDQPRIPADLGYYDLRLEDTRIQQADLAKKYGIDGFCYWHYWFGGGRRLLERPFEDVLKSGKPNYPLCLGWANHSWEAKNWSTKKIKNKILIEQKYNGLEDCIEHYKYASNAFRDNRYIKIDGKPIFVVWDPTSIPVNFDYLEKWRELARQDGFPDLIFIGFTYWKDKIVEINNRGYDYVLYDALLETRNNQSKSLLLVKKILRNVLSWPLVVPYKKYADMNINVLAENSVLPCILPNYDHTPRSGKFGTVLESSPDKFQKLLTDTIDLINSNKKNVPIIFIKSWNEWGEGNYLEPDLKHGDRYLMALKKGLKR
jgi:hypothetical protein